MSEIIDGLSMNIEQANIQKLYSVFPECFIEGKLDIDKLLSLCGQYIDNDFEKYKFEWKGKADCLRIAQKRSTGTLRPCKEESVNWDNTQNLYIEGDNLEVLKLLQTTYYGKVKMIYIDPPYNTGNDFVYEDDFADPMAKYKEVTSQTTKSNPETMGRYHTNWLNMMYPRLRLASNLLRDDGVIFISIDDNEVDNLKKLCNEVFGEENFIAQIIHKNNSMKNQSKFIGVSTEYIIVYAKNLFELSRLQCCWRSNKKGASEINATFNKLKAKGLSLDEIHKEILEMYSRPKYAHLSRWNKVDEHGVFKDQDLSRDNGSKDYTIINPNTGNPCKIPNRGWGKSYEELLRLQKEDLIWYGDDKTAPGMKTYITDDSVSVFDNFVFFDTSSDKKMIDKMFDAKVFDFPKSLELMKQLISLCTSLQSDDIILDFFSGSATTAHAVMQLNAEDGGNRKFIMVQLPEVCDEKSEAYKAGYKNICEIGKERIRRAGKKILEGNNSTLNSQNSTLDIGFRVFKLDTSNLETWDSTPIEHEQLNLLYERMNNMIHRVKSDRSDLDMIFEIMLKLGVPLTYSVNEIQINNKIAYGIGDDYLLLICLADDVQPEDVEQMTEYAPAKIIISRDSFKDDTAMANAHYILRDHEIELKLV